MLLVGEDGARVDLRIAGYQFPDAGPCHEDERGWDMNWLLVAGSVRTAEGASWSFLHPSLTTWEVTDLVSWLHQAAQGQVPVAAAIEAATADPAGGEAPSWWDRLESAGWMVLTEPDLGFAVGSAGGTQVQLLVGLGAESAPPPRRPDHPGWCSVAVAMSPADLHRAAAALSADLLRSVSGCCCRSRRSACRAR